MLSKDIVTYAKMRYELRAYLTFLFTQNIKNFMPEPSFEVVLSGLKRIKDEIKVFDAMYILDKNGMQISDVFQSNGIIENAGANFSNRAYYYEALDEQRCIITNPYPSKIDGNLVVTAAYPVYNQNHELLFVVCIDIHLRDALKISSPNRFFHIFSMLSVGMYCVLSLALSFIAVLLMVEGVVRFWSEDILRFQSFDIKDIFESTILLTLALAIFEEEVLGKNVGRSYTVHKTMIRFLGSIIIALAIEALMLVFKFTFSAPEQLLYAVYLIGGVAFLLIALAIYVKFAYGVGKKV